MTAATPQKASSKVDKKYSTLFLTMGVFMAGYGFFFAGFNVATNEPAKLIVDFALAAAGLVLTAFLVGDRVKAIHNHNNAVSEMAEKLAESLMPEPDPQTKQNVDDLVAVMKTVTVDGPPSTDEQLRQIELAYNARTGHKVTLSFRRDDDGKILGMDSEFVGEDAPEAAGEVAPVHVPVAAPDAPKKLTKSQQRRINIQKGRGAVTDDEWRLAQNEKRRAARAAKAASTTTTTTLAQTSSTLKERINQEK